MMIGIGITLVGGGRVGPPAGSAFVTTTDGGGNRVRVTTTNANGARVPVPTRKSA